ncbi:MAG: hypothetical protein FWC65_03395 [Treponema sp.]|nr:hypothetical protein [Treponema sp.]
MRDLPTGIKKKRTLRALAALLVVFILAGVFFSRPPVLVIADSSFYLIYGSQRQRLAAMRASLDLFRRVIVVPVSEHAGPDVIALVAEAVSRSPKAVLFPQRYFDGALQYRERNPGVPVLVMWGRNPPLAEFAPAPPGLVFVRTDTAADLFRAGASAAVLAGETPGVLFFADGALQDQCRLAFQSGLASQGSAAIPTFMDASVDYSSFSGIGCVVVAGPALRFLERNLSIPVILFSWIDPSITPRSVRMVFDDSPLALAAAAVRALSPEAGDLIIPSRPAVLSDRIGDRAEIRRLRRLAGGNLQNN